MLLVKLTNQGKVSENYFLKIAILTKNKRNGSVSVITPNTTNFRLLSVLRESRTFHFQSVNRTQFW